MQRLEDHLRKYKAIYTVIFGIIFLSILSTNLGRIENNTRSLEYDNSRLEKALIDINDNLDEIRKKYTDSFIWWQFITVPLKRLTAVQDEQP